MPTRNAPIGVPVEVLLEHRAWVRALARTLVHDAHTADDVEQEVWRMALERPPQHARSLRAWFATLVRRAAGRSARSDARRQRRLALALPPTQVPGPEEVVAQAELHTRVAQWVLELPEPYCSTVLYRYFHGLDPTQIAARVGEPVETVRTRLKRAIERLRERLDDEIGDDRRAWCLLVLGRDGDEPTATGVSSSAALAGVTKGVAMGTATKMVIAAGVLGVALGWLWLSRRAEVPDGSTGMRSAKVDVPDASQSAHRPRAKQQDPTPDPSAAAPAPDEALKSAHVTGRVVDEHDTGVPGALVVSVPEDATQTETPDRVGEKGSRTFRATTDSEGRFALRIDERATVLYLVVEAKAFAPAVLTEVRPKADVTLRVLPAGQATGHVTDVEGNPVAGATVRVRELFGVLEVIRVGVSDAQGVYRVEGLRRPKSPHPMVVNMRAVEVTAEGFAPQILQQSPEMSPNADFVLVRGAGARGSVADAVTGQPVGGARVVLWSTEGSTSSAVIGGGFISPPWAPRALAETRTASDGTYSFSHIPSQSPDQSGRPGPNRMGGVAAWKEGWCVASSDVTLAKDGETVDVAALKLWPAAVVEGITVTADGKPIAKALVASSVAGHAGREERAAWIPPLYEAVPQTWTESGPDGRFRIAGVRASPGPAVQATISGSTRAGSVTSPETSVTVDIVAGAIVSDVRLVLTPVAVPAVVFIVTDASGAPVPGALVQCFVEGLPLATSRTAIDGRVRLDVVDRGFARVDPSRPLVFSVSAPGLARATVEAIPNATAPPETQVSLAPEHRIAGRVDRSDGKPAGTVGIFVFDARCVLPTDLRRTTFPRDPRILRATYASTRTGDDGSFVVEGLPEGPYTVVAAISAHILRGTKPTGMDPLVSATARDVPTGATDLRLVLPVDDEPSKPSQALDVLATDAATGRPLPRFTARVGDPGPFGIAADPVSPGLVRFAALAFGTWTVHVEAEGYAARDVASVEVREGVVPPPLKVALSRGATVRGVVHFRDGPVPDGATISFQRELTGDETSSDFWKRSELAKDGSYVMRGMNVGRYRPVVMLHMTEPWFAADERILDVGAADGEFTCDVDAVEGAMVVITCEDPRLPEGVPPRGTPEQMRFSAGASLEVQDASRRLVFVKKGFREGNSYAAFVRAGEVVVTLRLPGDDPREQRVTVQPGKKNAAIRFGPR